MKDTKFRLGKLKKILLVLCLIFVVVTVVYGIESAIIYNRQPSTKYVQSARPTLFFHGFGSGSLAERHMARAAVKSGVTNTVIEVNVDKSGNVTLDGKIEKGAINPIVLVNYEDNKNPNYRQDGRYALAVVKKLQDEYGFTEMNMVGHSMGNMSIMYYMLDNSGYRTLPKLVKQVDIAGHFDGILTYDFDENTALDKENGKPNIMTETYKELTRIRDVYPENQIDVLNIFGDRGDGGDGAVSIISSKSLRYLVEGKAKSYREELIKGKGGRHSKLHENEEVDKLLIDFIWGK